jgi:hypothetical protein
MKGAGLNTEFVSEIKMERVGAAGTRGLKGEILITR